MKQDIRDLFKNSHIERKELPGEHREEFYQKLKASRPRRQSKLNSSYLWKVAIIIILFVAFTLTIFKTSDRISNQVVETPIEMQFDIIEKQYLAYIDREWDSFVSMADDERLVKRYKSKLENLSQDYLQLNQQLKGDPNNILLIEALVENLKSRLGLLKDIQNHIQIINQNNEQNENNF